MTFAVRPMDCNQEPKLLRKLCCNPARRSHIRSNHLNLIKLNRIKLKLMKTLLESGVSVAHCRI